jgi:hypothetical protein
MNGREWIMNSFYYYYAETTKSVNGNFKDKNDSNEILPNSLIGLVIF